MSEPAQPQPPSTGQRANDASPVWRYTAALAQRLEPAWQERWTEAGVYRQPNPGDPGFDPSRPKFYCLDMFPYPSGAGLHVGHPEGYTATDIISRYKRMKGFNVLHPMGWDAFGLPAEQYAIQTGVHPAITTRKAIDNFRRQLQRFGFCYDWSREFGTIDPDYYRWTQWIFLRLYDSWFDAAATARDAGGAPGRARPIRELVARLERAELPPTLNPAADEADASFRPPATWAAATPAQRRAIIDSYRLAYQGTMTVNWCPRLGTVLANDEVIDGRSERGGHPVLRKPMKQWMFRITAYAQRLLTQLDWLDWPESTKTMQREWIGRSEGAEIEFPIDLPSTPPLKVFTTRPDTIFGATYMVVAPEHPLCGLVVGSGAGIDRAIRDALDVYVQQARNRSDVERQENKAKTGVFTGVYAINPATGDRIPVWAADYVLVGYGTGAIMAVPAHDDRDYEFAKAFRLPIRDVLYDRYRLAMRYFIEHAPEEARREEAWRVALADFLGYVTSAQVQAAEFPGALQRIVSCPRRPGAVPPGAERRGTTRAVWLETIEDMPSASFADFERIFRTARVFDVMGNAFAAHGFGVNSANAEVSLDSLPSDEAWQRIVGWLERRGLGRRRVNFRLRDWTFSRQRYWGEPFPIVFDRDGNHYPVGEQALPVTLPELADYAPVESEAPQPLLAKARDWVSTTAGAAGVDPALLDPSTPVVRECNTMPGSAGSSWYAVRYCDPRNARRHVGRDAESYWMGPGQGSERRFGVDLYVGGSEHAVGHLLYSRFWQNVLFDLGELSTPEPFRRLFHQGLITSFAYQRADRSLVPVDEVEERSEGRFFEKSTGHAVTQIVAKMSKSLRNVINPDDVIAEYGADTFRLYEMYMGPLDASKPWNPRDIAGCFRFLQRAWRLCVDEQTGAPRAAPSPDGAVERSLHRLIRKVGEDIERLAFNTAIAAMIEFVNGAMSADKGAGALTPDQARRFALVLCPFAPHVAEELWSRCGGEGFVVAQAWPAYDERQLVEAETEIPVSVMGRVRTRIMVPTPVSRDAAQLEAAALADPKVRELIGDKPVKKIIAVPGKMINLVLG